MKIIFNTSFVNVAVILKIVWWHGAVGKKNIPTQEIILIKFLKLRIFRPCFLCCFLDSSARVILFIVPVNFLSNYFVKECSCTSCCLGSLSIAILRSKIRGAYKIKGTVCFDCFASCCCPVRDHYYQRII